MEGETVVEAVAGLGHELVDRHRRQLWVHLGHDRALVGLERHLVDGVEVDLVVVGLCHGVRP